MCCFIERSLSNMKTMLRTIPANSASVFLRQIVCGCCQVVLTEDDENRIASVWSLFSLCLFSSSNSSVSLTQSWRDRGKWENRWVCAEGQSLCCVRSVRTFMDAELIVYWQMPGSLLKNKFIYTRILWSQLFKLTIKNVYTSTVACGFAVTRVHLSRLYISGIFFRS